MDKLEQIKQKIQDYQNKTAVTQDLKAFLTLVLGYIKVAKDDFSSISKDNLATISEALKYIETEHKEVLSTVSQETKGVKEDFEQKLKEANDFLQEVKAIKLTKGDKGEDGLDGINPNPEDVVPFVLELLPEPKEVTGEEIADKLEALQGEAKLDFKALKNVPEWKGGKTGGVVARNIYQMGDVSLTSLANNDVLKWDDTNKLWVNGVGGGAGTIDGSGTTNELPYWVDSNTLGTLAVATYPSLTELSYVKGLTSAVQTQLNAKAPTTSPTFATSITGSYLTASEMLITDGSKNIVSAPVATYPSLTELTYLKGVTSAIQTQINTKLSGNGTAGYVPYYSSSTVLSSEAHFNYNSTTHVLHVHGLAGDATDGLLLESDNGTDIAILGAANTANGTWYGNHNFEGGQIAIGKNTTTLGKLILYGNTSGSVTIQPNAVAGSGIVLTAPATTGTIALTADKLSAFAATTSAELAGVISDETGSGALMFATSPVITTDITIPNTGLHLLDTNASHDLIIAPGSNLTADHTLTLTTGDADRTITLSGNPTLSDWFDQSVKTTANPTFGNLTITSFAANWTNAGRTVADLGTITTADINGGTIDGVTIGGASAGAGTFTTLTHGASTITGNQNIAAVPASDHTANGPTTSIFNLGATIALMDLVYLGSSSKWLLTDADAAATATGMLGICLDGGVDTDTTTVALAGAFVRDDTWNWTPGAILYVDTATPGAITATQPSGTDDVIRIVGYAVTADVIWFNPENDWITHT